MPERPLARSPDDVEELSRLCRLGYLYEVEAWIANGKPLQLATDATPKGRTIRSAMQIALETGQHSLTKLLLSNGYRLDLERVSPLDKALESRRWDLFDLLLEWGADLKTADAYSVLNTYNSELYERFRAAGYDLTQRHEMAAILGHSGSNRPLFGFAKRCRHQDPKIQMELNMALGAHVRERNEKGISLCLWAGADPHAPAPNLNFPWLSENESSGQGDEETRFIGWSAIEEAASCGNLEFLKRMRPDPAVDKIDHLYELTNSTSVITFLVSIRPPKDLTSILQWHLRWIGEHRLGLGRGRWTVEALLACGVRWQECDPGKLAEIRRSLLKADDHDLRAIVRLLKNPLTCAPETFEELTRTARMQERLLAIGVLKPRVSEREKRRAEVARLSAQYDREKLYREVWSQPVQQVARTYGFSDVFLGRICRKLQVPVPPRGYWARLRSGYKVKKPRLPGLHH